MYHCQLLDLMLIVQHQFLHSWIHLQCMRVSTTILLNNLQYHIIIVLVNIINDHVNKYIIIIIYIIIGSIEWCLPFLPFRLEWMKMAPCWFPVNRWSSSNQTLNHFTKSFTGKSIIIILIQVIIDNQPGQNTMSEVQAKAHDPKVPKPSSMLFSSNLEADKV